MGAGQRGTALGLASDILGVEFGVEGGGGLSFKQFANSDSPANGTQQLRVAA